MAATLSRRSQASNSETTMAEGLTASMVARRYGRSRPIGDRAPEHAARKAAETARVMCDPGGTSNFLFAREVSVAYAGRHAEVVLAIDRVNLSVDQGEFVCLLGPSGCGKTTFLNAVAGFLRISSGALTLRGKPIDRPGPDRAMVFQQPALLPWRDVLHNVTYGLEMSARVSANEAAARASALLELVGLSDFSRSYPHQLSGGMQQRVNLARALAVEPDLLLLDEPFASVDAQTRETLQVELLAICKHAKVTALFVTHDIGEAVFLADRVCVFSQRPGRVVHEVRVHLPESRNEARLKPEFLAYVGEIAEALGPRAAPVRKDQRKKESWTR
jgi:NitT/TauT family transport system ATP-binding protein